MFISTPRSQRPQNLKEQVRPICKAKVDMLNVFHHLKMYTKILARVIIVYINCVCQYIQ